jgi:hypothetical protein
MYPNTSGNPAGLSRLTLGLILSPIGLVLISAARLIVVSDYNTTTAVTIASASGYFNTLLGSVIPLIPAFAPYVALILLLFKRFFLSIIAFIFTAFITPTPLTLPQLLTAAKADWHQIAPLVSGEWLITVAVVLTIIAILWYYSRSLAEAISIVAVAVVAMTLLLIRPGAQVSLVAQADEGVQHGAQQLITWASSDLGLTAIAAVIIIFAVVNYYTPLGLVSTVVAIIATLALIPYVLNIYPFPHQRNYYVQALHEMWLPAQEIVLRSGLAYSGYVLSSDASWFTVLLTNKTIVYLPAAEVTKRSVCQPGASLAPPRYPPLLPLLYTQPPKTPGCPPSPVLATLVSIRSHGQSLRDISKRAHVTPWHIITVTNAHHHEQLSRAMRTYERARDWDAPTPAGQYFWYYPPVPH